MEMNSWRFREILRMSGPCENVERTPAHDGTPLHPAVKAKDTAEQKLWCRTHYQWDCPGTKS